MLRRGKRPRLDRSRVAALEELLAADGSVYKTVAELRSQLDLWRGDSEKAFDADRYYDKERAAGYTERMQGPQEALTRRVLQLCSLRTQAVTDTERADSLLAVDLGCGSGLSTQAAVSVKGTRLAVIGLDLSTEMLREKTWADLSEAKIPLAGERVKCDLSQPLPFRSAVFDVAYSVAAVHYLARDAVQRTASQRIRTFLTSLRGVMTNSARPCCLQAFLTKEEGAVQMFLDEALSSGWSLCQLVVDQTHGSTAERDFLYLLPRADAEPPLQPPPPCALHRRNGQRGGATCALALEAWARAQCSRWPILLDPAHRAWLQREHLRWAKRLVRLRSRCSAGASLDHAEVPDSIAEALAQQLGGMISGDKHDGEHSPNESAILTALHAGTS